MQKTIQEEGQFAKDLDQFASDLNDFYARDEGLNGQANRKVTGDENQIAAIILLMMWQSVLVQRTLVTLL